MRFVIPAPAVAEIAAGKGNEVDAMNKLLARMGGSHVEPLDDLAARAAGLSLRSTLRVRAAGERRDGVKYDALIAGIAHRLGARYLLTANPRDFKKHLLGMSSQVEVVDVATARSKGQLRLIDREPA